MARSQAESARGGAESCGSSDGWRRWEIVGGETPLFTYGQIGEGGQDAREEEAHKLYYPAPGEEEGGGNCSVRLKV